MLVLICISVWFIAMMRRTTKTLTLLLPHRGVTWGASVGAGFGDVSSSLSISLLGKVTANVTLLCYIARAKGQAPKKHTLLPRLAHGAADKSLLSIFIMTSAWIWRLMLLPVIYFIPVMYTQKKKLLNELKKIRVNFSTKFNYIFPPKSNLFEMSCCNLVV